MPIYKLVDWYEEPVKGSFYQAELQRVQVYDDDLFQIENVLKYRGKGKNRQALVHWLGWPKKFDSWINVSQLVDYSTQK